MLKGFKNFMMRGDVIVIAVGLVVALAFSNLVKAFTDNIINPLIAAAQPGNSGPGLGWQLAKGGGEGTFLNLGGFISAIIYFIVFMGVCVFPDYLALQGSHGADGEGCVRRSASNQDLSGVPV